MTLLADTYTVDQAVEALGFGWFQIKLSFFTGIVWVIMVYFYIIISAALINAFNSMKKVNNLIRNCLFL